VLSIDETPGLKNPSTGWLYNTNNSPWSASGAASPKKADFPVYVDAGSENPRGIHAIRVLKDKTDFTLDTLRDAAFDSYLPEFAVLIPALVKSFDALPASSPLKKKLTDPIQALRGWDYRWSTTSVPTALAVFWGEEMWTRSTSSEINPRGTSSYPWMETEATPAVQLDALSAAVDKLASDFGTWNTPWGEINRFQRLTGDIVHPFSDNGPSIPVGFTSSRWGSLASFGAGAKPGTKKWYGTTGNSFVAGVEFGDQVRAKAVTAGGESGNPKSPHFNDQAQRYATGNLRDVYFYADDLKAHTSRTYRPGK
jgi:acyl-homoserine-lactone acylase